MKIETAKIRVRDGQPIPVIESGGRLYCIETKPTILEAGIAEVRPLLPDLEEDWDAPVLHRAQLHADPRSGRLAPQVLDHFTDDRGVVALAKKFMRLAAAGEAKEGDL